MPETTTAYLEFTAWVAAFPLRADVGADIASKAATITRRALDGQRPLWRPPTMSQQCTMDASQAVTWQAALVLTERRKLHTASQTKLDKANAKTTGFRNRGLTMATAREASAYVTGRWNACHGATDACRFACVGSQTGQGRLSSSLIARVGRTLAMLHDVERFFLLMVSEIDKLDHAAARKGTKLAFRANIATDHARLAAALAETCEGVAFYDYSAIMGSVRRNDGVRRVYSRKDGRTDQALAMLDSGHGVCVVFDVTARSKGPLPATWQGHNVIDGDIDDLWFIRSPATGPFVVGLRVKATTSDQLASAIDSGFAVASNI